MKTSVILTIMLFLLVAQSYAKKEIKYAVSEIPAELKSNAKAVIRYEEHEFILESDNSAKEKIKFAITILNENGYPFSRFVEYYNKFIKIQNINATVYSASGEKLHRIKHDDIMDVSATSSGSIYDDNRVKTFDPKTKDYPFTIEYSFEREYKGIFSFPTWHLFKDYHVAVEKAVFRIKTDDPQKIRINQRNLDKEAVKTTEDDYSVVSWEFNNYTARKKEPFCQHIIEYTPVIQLAPVNINIKGNKGKCDSWKSYGSFIAELNKGKNDLPDETKQKVTELTKNASSDYEKIKLIYEYMQNKTRYVSIQVGMGGWQPFEAELVDRLGYGDCKALSNYMMSLLDGVGINSFYTLVKAGGSALKLNKDFPSNQFNHAILCVPLKQDTLWLECTSQQIPCGYLSDFTDDRDVLLIKEEGGEIAHTKAYQIHDNVQCRSVKVQLDEMGHAIANVQTKYSGIQYNNISPVLRMDKTDQKKYVLSQIDIPNFDLISFEHEDIKMQVPYINENLSLNLNNYASTIGSRLILPLNLMNKQKYTSARLRKRESNVLVRRPFKDIDTISYTLPNGFSINKAPDPITINSTFGFYKASASIEGNTIIYSREFIINKGEYPAETYNDFKEFFEKVNEADQMKCLLTKQ